MNRRQFIQNTIAISGMTTSNLLVSAGVTALISAEAKVNWPIGRFNRPWTKWSFEETLKEIKAAGYKSTGIAQPPREEPFIGANQRCLNTWKI